MNNSEAINVLYRSGVLARSKDEEELLDWFRKLPPEAQRLEFARAQGMAQAMGYAMLEAKIDKLSDYCPNCGARMDGDGR